jgi:L-threonylcarbamoyladenylate synthase
MNVLKPTRENLDSVAIAILAGKHAILPTETVYGLAADASNAEAVQKIFELKGRPSDNPLIVHVSSLKQAEDYVQNLPDIGHSLAEAFMPGPLTLVLPKKPHVSDTVTGGLDTVAIRMPDHPACLAVMDLGNVALAMPSANLFMQLSPTNALMIDPVLGDQVFAIVDGGPCMFGIESTVLDITGEPAILRPGSITRDEIQTVLHRHVQISNKLERRSPGMYKKHYSPKTKCGVIAMLSADQPGLVFGLPRNENQIELPKEPREYARQLYASMAEMDTKGLDHFWIQAPPEDGPWIAVWDRLIKATAL